MYTTDATLSGRTEISARIFAKIIHGSRKNYKNLPKECLAVVCAVLLLWPNLKYRQILLQACHDVLRQIPNLVLGIRKLVQWRLCPFRPEFDISQHPGIKIRAASALFRLKKSRTNNMALEEEISKLTINNLDHME